MNTSTSMNAQRNAMTIEEVRQAGVTDEMQAVMDQVQKKTLLMDTLEEVRQAGVTDEMQAVMDQVMDQVQKKTLLLDALDQVHLYSNPIASWSHQIFKSYWMLRNNIIGGTPQSVLLY